MTEVFVSDDVLIDSLFVLTDDAAYIANPAQGKAAGMVTRLRQGAAVKSVVPGAEEIRYADMASVQAFRWSDEMQVRYRQGARTRVREVIFKNASTRNAAFAALERRLSPSFTRRASRYGISRAILAPLIATTAAVTLANTFIRAVSDIGRGTGANNHGGGWARHPAVVWAFEFLGPNGTAILGVVGVLLCIGWLVGRVKKTLLIMTLAPVG